MASLPDVPDRPFLASQHIHTLLATHPNAFRSGHAAEWKALVQLYHTGTAELPVPPPLAALIHAIRHLQLPRDPIPIHGLLSLPSEHGMSPKKAHEVARMATYIQSLIDANHLPADRLRIVDIGAGQGYLTRALKVHLPGAHILALDADTNQTCGAQKWEHRLLPNAHPPIDHKTILINPENLLRTVDDWVRESQPATRVPVLLVALHACGSLTPDILRAYVSAVNESPDAWYPAGVVAVGCCYNLMLPHDFPLSKAYLSPSDAPLNLPPSAFHLAAQIPGTWLRTTAPHPAVALAVRKVTWRALLERLLPTMTTSPAGSEVPPTASASNNAKSTTVPARWSRRPETWTQSEAHSNSGETPKVNDLDTSTGHTPTLMRLGRLPDRSYSSWQTFLRAVEQKMGVCFPERAFDEETKGQDEDNTMLERKLEVLHTMRCLIGPVVESAILRDRVAWIKEELNLDLNVAFSDSKQLESKGNPKQRVNLVNLFDQATGSGRNVAIVVAPILPSFDA